MRHLPLLIAALISVASVSCASSSTPAPTPQPPPATDPRSSVDARRQWLDMFARAYFPGRSGQVFVVPKEGWFVTSREPLYAFMHGSPHPYDTRIPVLFHGAPFIKAGQYSAAARQQDVAPTIGALIGAAPLPTYTGRILTDAITNAGRPRVVTVFVLDAMRADYFDTHASVMPTLSRLRKEGAWFSQAHTNVMPTVTGVGHANI
ncbi:MAG TPA: alkaline phosphatase family protein, partial [Vicinamibacterales bacterium]|nr:alkaline phosphatase family protein [Vicinamibacterales bacterium]